MADDIREMILEILTLFDEDAAEEFKQALSHSEDDAVSVFDKMQDVVDDYLVDIIDGRH